MTEAGWGQSTPSLFKALKTRHTQHRPRIPAIEHRRHHIQESTLVQVSFMRLFFASSG